jgi:small subunit ribosomal protein S5
MIKTENKKPPRDQEESEFDEKVVQINRVSKKTKGGNQISFSALTVVGDRQGKVGVGLGRSKDVASAIGKGMSYARKHMVTIPLQGTTIPHHVLVKFGAAKILLKPAPQGSGLIAGGPVRAVVQAAGIKDMSSKILGTRNKASNVYATFKALKKLKPVTTEATEKEKE